MKKEPEAVQKDYSFLQAMSTESLNEILRCDIDLEKDESDTDLILNVMEVLEARAAESGADTGMDMETALNDLHDRVRQRERMFADIENLEDADNSVRTKRHWLRIAGIAAVIALVLTIGFSAASAMGYDIWGGMVHWTKETFGFGDEQPAFYNDEKYVKLKDTLKENEVSIPVLPNWLPAQYFVSDIREYNDRDMCRIVAMATADDKSLYFQLVKYSDEDPGSRLYEMEGDSIQQYESHGVIHYIMVNDDSFQIVWARERYQIILEISDSTISEIDLKRVIDSIYKG